MKIISISSGLNLKFRITPAENDQYTIFRTVDLKCHFNSDFSLKFKQKHHYFGLCNRSLH